MITKKQAFHFAFLTLIMLSVSFVSYTSLNQVAFAVDDLDGDNAEPDEGYASDDEDDGYGSGADNDSDNDSDGNVDENANGDTNEANGVGESGNNLQQLNNNYMSDNSKKQSVNLADKYSGLNPAGHDVVIYTKEGCHYCTRAKAILREYNVSFTEIVPQNQAEKDAMIKKADGRRTFPEIFIDDELVGGCQELIEIDDSGELAEKLK